MIIIIFFYNFDHKFRSDQIIQKFIYPFRDIVHFPKKLKSSHFSKMNGFLFSASFCDESHKIPLIEYEM